MFTYALVELDSNGFEPIGWDIIIVTPKQGKPPLVILSFP